MTRLLIVYSHAAPRRGSLGITGDTSTKSAIYLSNQRVALEAIVELHVETVFKRVTDPRLAHAVSGLDAAQPPDVAVEAPLLNHSRGDSGHKAARSLSRSLCRPRETLNEEWRGSEPSESGARTGSFGECLMISCVPLGSTHVHADDSAFSVVAKVCWGKGLDKSLVAFLAFLLLDLRGGIDSFA